MGCLGVCITQSLDAHHQSVVDTQKVEVDGRDRWLGGKGKGDRGRIRVFRV